jgi:SAM-dependent methyltransferase
MRWAHLIPAQAHVLDVACGSGRHMQYLQTKGFHVLGVDRDENELNSAKSFGEVLCADVENAVWPLTECQFDAVVVTNYLWRPSFTDVLASLKPHGVLIYETFAQGNETVGKPSREEFLLGHGELLQMCQHMRIVAYEDVFLISPDRYVQRIVAVLAGQDRTTRFAGSSDTTGKS